jgi:metallo-beta-lactamase family protein
VIIHFLGANKQVTGSRYCLEAGDGKILVDCGLFQERDYRERNWSPSPVDVTELDAVVLTHVHIDHCGLLPRLVAEGFQGPIYMTRPSKDLLGMMLRDTARIQKEDAAYKIRRHKKASHKPPRPVKPLYTEEDVERTLPLASGVDYGEQVSLGDDLSVTFHDAGHILGSSMLEIKAGSQGDAITIVFSGDIGLENKPIVRDPTFFQQADFVVMESTYGDRNHAPAGNVEDELAAIILRTVDRGGNVVIPTFAVERAQELMYYLARLCLAGRIPQLPVYLDSPMAINATDVFKRHRDCYDSEAWQLIMQGQEPFDFPGLVMTRSSDESRAINQVKGPAIIMSTSGMCTAGRIKHHLRQNIGRPESTILFVGYQAQGSLGRHIVDGKEEVRIHGRQYAVEAEIVQLSGFSGHADQAGLVRWLSHLAAAPRQVFLTHGDSEAAECLQQKIIQESGWPVKIPEYGEIVDLG